MSETDNGPDPEELNSDPEGEGAKAESRRAFIRKLAYIPPAMQT